MLSGLASLTIRHRSRRHEAAAASCISSSCRQSYLCD